MSMRKNDYILDGIPISTYEVENGNKKPLIYFFHGFTGNKDANIMGRGEILANLGYYVVAIDAYMHGERMTNFDKNRSNINKYEDIIEVVIQTAEDAKKLFHKYFRYYENIITDSYHAYGVSMGSLISFYLGTIDTKLKTIVGLVPTPSFIDFYKDKAIKYNFNHGFIYDKKINYYKEIDPLKNYKLLENKNIFMACGLHDDVVNPKYAIKLNELLPNTKIKFYETGHVSTKEMLDDSFNYLKNNF